MMLVVGEQIQGACQGFPIERVASVRASRRVSCNLSPRRRRKPRKSNPESRVRPYWAVDGSNVGKRQEQIAQVDPTRGRLSCRAPAVDRLAHCRLRGAVGRGWVKWPPGSYPVFGFRRERGFRRGGVIYSRLVAGASMARGQQISSLSLRTKIARSA
jgi:hypothetical protein